MLYGYATDSDILDGGSGHSARAELAQSVEC